MSPEFSEKTKKKIREIVACYPRKEAAILPVLHLTQKEFGCISEEEEKRVAEILELKPIQVREVVTFYTMFNQKPIGKYHIQVCSNLSCSWSSRNVRVYSYTKRIWFFSYCYYLISSCYDGSKGCTT